VSADDVAVTAPAAAGMQTPLQRERARTIFEKGAPGRRAFTAPALDVPEADPSELLLQRTHYARETLTALDGVEALHTRPVVREFAVRLDVGGRDSVSAVIERCAAEGVAAGVPLGGDYPEFEDGLLVAITERRSRADIDRLAEVLGAAVAAERPTAAGVA